MVDAVVRYVWVSRGQEKEQERNMCAPGNRSKILFPITEKTKSEVKSVDRTFENTQQ